MPTKKNKAQDTDAVPTVPAGQEPSLGTLQDSTLRFNDAPQIKWILVRDAVKLLSPNNPKLHDMGSIMDSIARYGFQELPKFDATVGWIKAGNGRLNALDEMEKARDANNQPAYPLPRGLAQDKDGKWAMPLLIGTDAKNENEALSYLIDANNLTMMGGDFGALDLSKMWNEKEYDAILMRLADDKEFTVSIPAETLVFMGSAGNALLDYYKTGRDDNKQIDSALDSVMPLKISVIIRSRKHEIEVAGSLRELFGKHPEWDAYIEE